MTELMLTNQIIEYLNYTGKCFVWRVNSGMITSEYKGKTRKIRMARAGTSDICGIRFSDGRFIALEVKLPGKEGNLTSLQSEYLDKMRNYGALTGMVTNCEHALRIIEVPEGMVIV